MTAVPNTNESSGFDVYLRLLKYLKPLWLSFALSIIGFMLFAASQPALAKLMGVIVNAIEAKDADARYYVPALLIAIYIVRGIGTFMGTYFMAVVANRVVHSLRTETFSHIMHLPTRFFDDNNSGQIISRVLFNTGMVTGAATDALKIIFREGFTIIGLLAYAFYLNWKMSLIFLAIAPLIGLIVVVVGKRLRKLSGKVQDSLAGITQICSEAIGNNRTIKSFIGEQREIRRFTEASLRNLKQQMKIVKLSALNAPVMQLIIILAMCLIVFLILQPEFLAVMDTGMYLSYITTISLIPKSLKQLSGVNAVIQKGIAAADSVFSVIDLEIEKNPGRITHQRFVGDIEVSNLNFQYQGSDELALTDVNFEAKPGQVIALVGRSGSGKSTLASLLARFYDYRDGSIKIDGQEIRDYDLYDYRSQVGIVTQAVTLFNDTVAANIAYGLPPEAVDLDAIKQAADKAYATEFIEAMPGGFEAMIGENGVKLSGGQKQRIAIARTLLRDTPILILDEATSALDNESERAIQKALDSFMKDRTTVVIAHRLSTIINADKILVMKDGAVVESADHQTLLAKGGYYARLHSDGFDKD